MESNNPQTPNFNLPSPEASGNQPSQNPNASGEESPKPNEKRNIEVPIATPASQISSQSNPITAAQQPHSPSLPVSQPPAQQSTTTQPQSDSDLDAEDSDLIEKAWVLKAKSIVDQTRDDPYNQNKAMSKMKADYLKKRYNKNIKASDE